MYLVYEYAKRGSLGNLLHSERANDLDWDARVRIVQGLAHAISYLHHDCSPPIVHRDISLNNVLLGSDFVPRLSDFGLARLLKPDSSNWTTVAGSYGYMAPGYHNSIIYSYSYTITISATLSGFHKLVT